MKIFVNLKDIIALSIIGAVFLFVLMAYFVGWIAEKWQKFTTWLAFRGSDKEI